MKRALILHGWKGSADQSWLGWLGRELTQRDFRVLAPQFPRTDRPDAAGWAKEVARLIGDPDDELVLVGHSLGCFVIQRYLSGLDYDGQLAGGVLVAGGAWGEPDYAKIKRLARRRICIYSDNDPMVAPADSERLAELIDAERVMVAGMGHFNDLDAGLPQALDAVLSCYEPA